MSVACGSLGGVVSNESLSVWELLREYAAGQSGSFTSQEVLSWFRRHAPAKANDRTVRTHIRGACWNVGDRSRFRAREPFLTRIDRGLFRRATPEELQPWRADHATDHPTDKAAAAPQLEVTSGIGRAETVELMPSNGTSGAAVAPSPEWHTETNIQASLVTSLATQGWRILAVANTATKEHGIDVVAERDGHTVGIEVKGFPSREYADPARAGESKRTSPSTQAAHWYSQAVLAAMRLRGKEPTWRSVIVLPDFPRYRALHAETSGSLDAARIDVWWIDSAGTLLGV